MAISKQKLSLKMAFNCVADYSLHLNEWLNHISVTSILMDLFAILGTTCAPP